MVSRERAQALYEGAIELVQHDGYFVPDKLDRTLKYNRRYNAYGVCNVKVKRSTKELVYADVSISKYFVDNNGFPDCTTILTSHVAQDIRTLTTRTCYQTRQSVKRILPML